MQKTTTCSAWNKNFAGAGQLRLLRHQFRQSSYLPQQSKDCLLPLTKMNELWNVEFWGLKKLPWKLYKSDHIQSLNFPLNMYKKKKKINKSDCKRKITFVLSQLVFNFNIEKTKIMIFYINFVSWAYIYSFWLTACIFICEYTLWSWADKSETLES